MCCYFFSLIDKNVSFKTIAWGGMFFVGVQMEGFMRWKRIYIAYFAFKNAVTSHYFQKREINFRLENLKEVFLKMFEELFLYLGEFYALKNPNFRFPRENAFLIVSMDTLLGVKKNTPGIIKNALIQEKNTRINRMKMVLWRGGLRYWNQMYLHSLYLTPEICWI